MSVIRVQKNKNFTVMSNTHLFDKNLSLKAAGLLSKILALPDDWNYSIKGLCAICKENETAVKNALNELRDNRYVIVERIEPSKETGGRIQYEYFVYEQPQGEENKKIDVKEAYRAKQEQEKQHKEKQDIENLWVDGLRVENQGGILNTNISSTDKTNTDTINTDGLNTDVKYALEDKKQSSKGNIYASVPEEREERTPQKQNRYIPQDYTEEQLIKHIKQPICDYMKKEYGGMASEEMSSELIKIIMSFHREYEGKHGKRHRVLSDKAYENIVDRYMNPPEEMTDDYSIETYEAMMERYFEVDYNKRGNYKGNITLGLSHFMSDGVRNNLYCQTCK